MVTKFCHNIKILKYFGKFKKKFFIALEIINETVKENQPMCFIITCKIYIYIIILK